MHPLVGYLIAGGIEWTYLRGLATAAKVKTDWTAILTWSAFAIMVVWGVLSVARLLQGDDAPKVADDAVWWLAAAHVVPIAWLSLCSAMCHRAAAQASATEREQAERENKARERKLQEQRDTIQLELERKQSELEIWQKAQEIKRSLKNGASRVSVPTSEVCPACGQTMDSADVGLMRSARARGARFNGCKMCRSKEA